MDLSRWLRSRRLGYIARRAVILLQRYGPLPGPAMRRVERVVRGLVGAGCRPTFPVPGHVIDRSPAFIRSLQDSGCELAVHGYDHLDYQGFTPEEGSRRLDKALAAFDRHGIVHHGFRCPYLSCTPELRAGIAPGRFCYSSNEAVLWPVIDAEDETHATPVYDTLTGFYTPRSSEQDLCLPTTHSNLVEIPVSLPDDLQLFDGLQFGADQVADVWKQILERVHGREEAFVLQFHPETGDRCLPVFRSLLEWANGQSPHIWVAPLADIGRWWQNKASFQVKVERNEAGRVLEIACSDDATVLVKGMDVADSVAWHGEYRLVRARTVEQNGGPLPFVGVSAGAPEEKLQLLRDAGYILRQGDESRECAVQLDLARSSRTDREIVEAIEQQPGPLLRFGRWPRGYRCALAITGDLDALSLWDYASRLFAR